MLAGAMAHAGPSFRPGNLALPAGSVQAPLASNVRLYGIPADIRLVEIPADIPQAVSQLTSRYPFLSDLGVYPGLAVLSGHQAGRPWVVALQSVGPGKTQGSVMMLSALPPRLPSPPGWLPAGAQLRLDIASQEGMQRSLQQVWTLSQSPDALRVAVVPALLRAGWVPEGPGQDAGRWIQGHKSMHISITAIDGGSGMLMLLHERASP
ncbi:hypothetical protein [Bordetella petrii]|uniref:hypothetical protein n=1 Tax=Bordetella petrii TaxID=94624 RepID=UPI001E47A786|nr:hypothetical protein [Bordetella petrii]MCD0501637.1 hypothetical protein [Bordetella petrii]